MLRFGAKSLFAVSLGFALFALGCELPEDETPGEGSAPEASGLIHGAVLYAGPRPNCVYDGELPTELIGNVVLLMFESDNEPPPSGGATSASNVLLIPGREFFSLDDCLPPNPGPADLGVVVTRSAQFDWPEITLAAGMGSRIDYQIRGFMDRDGDWIPFFSVLRLATHGDVAGGAFINTSANPPQFARIGFGSREDFPNGQVVDGVSVALAGFVNTELPAFSLTGGTRAGRSEDLVPAVSDAAMREEMIYQQTRMELTLIDPTSDTWAPTLEAAGMNINPHPSRFAWFTPEVDANRDGLQDLHPILGSGGVLWEHPVVILRRARNPIEIAVGIPDALVIATVRPTQTGTKDTFAPSIQIGVAPVAAVDWTPAPECRIPILAPGSLAENLERIPVDCQELPTGNYDVNVLSGLAGGTAINYREELMNEDPPLPDSLINTLVSGRTDNDWVIEAGSFSSQAWSIPNELGCPDPYRPNALDENGQPTTYSQVDEDRTANCGDPATGCDATGTLMHCSQGPAGRWSLVDTDGSNAPDAASTADGHGTAACQTAVRASTGMPDTVVYMPIPDTCCTEQVTSLCGLPLCELRPRAHMAGEGDVRMIREIVVPDVDYTVNADGSFTPLCVPFLPPVTCCR